MKKIKLIFAIFFCFSLLFSSAHAYDFTGISSGDMEDIAGDLLNGAFDNISNFGGIDQEELEYNISTMNLARQKKQAPQVSIILNPSNPNPGEKITAVATPTYFMNDIKDMYFTWYLRTADCPAINYLPENKNDANKQCDLDNDGRIDINDYKIKAARIIANNDFDYRNANYYDPCGRLYERKEAYKAFLGGNDQGGGTDPDHNEGGGNKNHTCYIQDTRTGNEYKISCDRTSDNGSPSNTYYHLFPRHTTNCTPCVIGDPILSLLGDGRFCSMEEKFWHTDPNNPDTAGTGNNDEANLVGLGVNEFTWTYQKIEKNSDQIGVVVEGISPDPTQEADSSYRVMWALLKNKCSYFNNYVDDYIDEHGAFTSLDPELPGFGSNDINNCLRENFIDPSDAGTSQKISVELSYSPQNPINDSSSSRSGDQIVVNSSVFDAKNPAYLKYVWQVSQGDDIGSSDSWLSIPKSDIPDSSQTIGLGLDTFKFSLNLSNPQKYIKVKLTVSENLGNGTTREGHSDVIIPISSSSNQIKVNTTEVSDDTNLTLSLGDTEICEDGINQTVCPISKNEIIGLSLPGNDSSGTPFSGTSANPTLWSFLWTIDGEPLADTTDENIQTSTAFFPILKNVGERYTINLTATKSTTGEKINLTRVFEVVDPKIKISSADTNACKPEVLGNYVDLEGKQWSDESENNFLALADYPIKLQAKSSNPYLSPENFNWLVDNNAITEDSAETYGFNIDNNTTEKISTLTLPAKSEGETYDVTVGALYTQNNLIKKALNKYWGVSYDQFYEKIVSDDISIKIVNFVPLAANQPTNKKIIASLYSSLPSYLAFLFRIVLTAFVILISSSLILSLSPERKNEN